MVGCRCEVRTSLVSVQFGSHCSGFRWLWWARRPRLANRFFMSNSLISNQRGENPSRQTMFLQITLNHSVLLEAPHNYSHANFNTLIFFLLISTWDIWKTPSFISLNFFHGEKRLSVRFCSVHSYSGSLLQFFSPSFFWQSKIRRDGHFSLTLDEIYAHKEKNLMCKSSGSWWKLHNCSVSCAQVGRQDSHDNCCRDCFPVGQSLHKECSSHRKMSYGPPIAFSIARNPVWSMASNPIFFYKHRKP